MSNIQIESDLKDILNKLDSKLDKLSDDFDHKLSLIAALLSLVVLRILKICERHRRREQKHSTGKLLE